MILQIKIHHVLENRSHPLIKLIPYKINHYLKLNSISKMKIFTLTPIREPIFSKILSTLILLKANKILINKKNQKGKTFLTDHIYREKFQ